MKPQYCLNDKATNLQTKEGLLTVSRKPDNIAEKSNDDDNVELNEQSKEELLNSELLPD